MPARTEIDQPGHATGTRALGWLIILTFALVGLAGALAYPFPSPFDELQHYSVVRAQFEHPDLFADPRRYMIVDPAAPTHWLGARNYINHPALYYILLSPLTLVGDGVLALRLANLAMATGALALTIAAGWRLLPKRVDRVAFAIIAACFPKAMLLAGMVNNDNLAMLAAAMVFAGLTGMKRGRMLIAMGLAIAGWVKLTALISLAALVGIWLLFDRRHLFARQSCLAAAGVFLGILPFVVMQIQTGTMVPVNADVFGVPPAARPVWGFSDYTQVFLRNFADKWPAGDDTLPRAVSAALIFMTVILAGVGAWLSPVHRRLIVATLAATAVTFALHLGFGWHSFQTIGDLSISQTRYYNTLWPGFALGGAVTIGRLKARFAPAPVLLIPYIAPTTIVPLLIMAVGSLYG
jgi:4-amino-4-deoxy-L-arabinose transferase-like glycosyltransferase